MLKANADTIYMYNRRVGGVVINFMLFKEQGRARGGVLPYTDCTGMYHCPGYGFQAFEFRTG